MANIRLAANRVVKGEELAQYHTIICWDRLAETVAEYVKKGKQIFIEGRLEYRTFQDEEGKERGVCEIVASDVQFLGRRPARSGASQEVTDQQGDVSRDENQF